MTHPLEQRLAELRPNLVEDAQTVAVFESVELTMFGSKFNPAGTEGSIITVADLRERWDLDAHYTQYVAGRRLLKEEASEVRWFTTIVIDLDPITTATDDDFWTLVIRSYRWPNPPNLVYQTRRGAHLLWWLDPPLDDAEDFERRRSLLVERLQPLLAKTAYKADPACKDWTRLFRAARVLRTDRNDDGTWIETDLRDRPIWALHAEGLDVTEWELPPKAPVAERRLLRVGGKAGAILAERWLARQLPAVSGEGGHNRTFRTACRLFERFGLDAETVLQLMERWNAHCSPPWSEHELRHKVRDAEIRVHGQNKETK